MTDQLTKSEMQEMIGRSLFHQLFRPTILDVDHQNLKLSVALKLSETLERQPGTQQWHGGAISAAIDTIGCYGLAMITGEPLPTINFRTDYLRPAIDTDLIAIATIRRAGRSIAVVDVDVHDDKDRLVAVGRACYSAKGTNK